MGSWSSGTLHSGRKKMTLLGLPQDGEAARVTERSAPSEVGKLPPGGWLATRPAFPRSSPASPDPPPGWPDRALGDAPAVLEVPPQRAPGTTRVHDAPDTRLGGHDARGLPLGPAGRAHPSAVRAGRCVPGHRVPVGGVGRSVAKPSPAATERTLRSPSECPAVGPRWSPTWKTFCAGEDACACRPAATWT